MDLEVRKTDNSFIIKIDGDITEVYSRDLHEKLTESLRSKVIYLDLSGVGFVSSMLLNSLISFFKDRKDRLDDFYIVNAPERVVDLMNITHTDNIFKMVNYVN